MEKEKRILSEVPLRDNASGDEREVFHMAPSAMIFACIIAKPRRCSFLFI